MITTRQFKNTNVFLPLMGFGIMRLPVIDGDASRIDEKTSIALIDRAYEAGIRYFDTAVPYHGGRSEEFIGRVIKRYPRESVCLADKMPMWTLSGLDEARKIFNDQLERCGVDYFDHYLIHSLKSDFWPKAEAYGLFDFLSEMKAQGKIRRLGFSFHDSPELLKEIANAHPWDFAQIQLNFFDWEHYRSREQYEVLESAGLPVVIMEPLRGGTLGALTPAAADVLTEYNPNASLASWSFRFAASLPNVVTVLSGMSKMEHVEDNISTMTDFKPLSAEEREVMAKALRAYHNSCAVPCTSCRYCSICPQGIDMPSVFYLYNQLQLNGDKQRYLRKISELPATSHPSRCLKCGKCIKVCPQHINVPAELEKAVEALK